MGRACSFVDDFHDARRYYKQAKEGYEEQLRPDDAKTLETTYFLICANTTSYGETIKKLRDVWKRCERALGEENVVILDTLNSIGINLYNKGAYEVTKEVWEKCLAGQLKVLGEDHKQTLNSLNNLGVVYGALKNYEKALECYEIVLKGRERTLGMSHPATLGSVVNIAVACHEGTKDYGKAEEFYQTALEGYEAQLGKEHEDTKRCAFNLGACYLNSGQK